MPPYECGISSYHVSFLSLIQQVTRFFPSPKIKLIFILFPVVVWLVSIARMSFTFVKNHPAHAFLVLDVAITAIREQFPLYFPSLN